MIPVLGLPHYNQRDLLARCLASVDHPVEKVVVINNGPNEIRERLLCVAARQVHLIQHPNAGVAASWNEIVKLFPSPWWMFVNDDLAFVRGDLAKMVAMMEDGVPRALVYGNHGASWFAASAWGLEQAGLWDENFYPAYLEDCDMSYRCSLLGLPCANTPDCHAIHGHSTLTGSCTINSSRTLAQENVRTHGNNFQYYQSKWGGINGKETFKTPFNDPHWPVWAWKFCLTYRQGQQWKP